MSPEFLWPVLALIIAVGLAYAGFSYMTRNKSKDAQAEAATRRVMSTPSKDETEARRR